MLRFTNGKDTNLFSFKTLSPGDFGAVEILSDAGFASRQPDSFVTAAASSTFGG